MRILGLRRKNPREPLAVAFRREAPLVVGPARASEALSQAHGLISSVDPRAYPVFMSTDQIDEQGRSDRWEVSFDAPALVATLRVEFGLDFATLRGVPHVSDKPGSLMPDLWERMNATQRKVFTDRWFSWRPLSSIVDSDAAISQLLAEHSDIDFGSEDRAVSFTTDRADELWELTVGSGQWWTPLF